MKNNPNITSLEDILDRKYGSRGTEARKRWEQRYKTFKKKILQNKAIHE